MGYTILKYTAIGLGVAVLTAGGVCLLAPVTTKAAIGEVATEVAKVATSIAAAVTPEAAPAATKTFTVMFLFQFSW